MQDAVERDRVSAGVGSDESDGLLARRVAGGDRSAFAEVYSRHGSSAYWLALQALGPADAEQVVQDVFLAFWREPAGHDPGAEGLWTYLRRQIRLRCRELAPDPAALLGRVHESDCGALSGLPIGEREALALAYFGGLTCRQIAGIVGVEECTVRVRLRDGLVRLEGRAPRPPVTP